MGLRLKVLELELSKWSFIDFAMLSTTFFEYFTLILSGWSLCFAKSESSSLLSIQLSSCSRITLLPDYEHILSWLLWLNA